MNDCSFRSFNPDTNTYLCIQETGERGKPLPLSAEYDASFIQAQAKTDTVADEGNGDGLDSWLASFLLPVPKPVLPVLTSGSSEVVTGTALGTLGVIAASTLLAGGVLLYSKNVGEEIEQEIEPESDQKNGNTLWPENPHGPDQHGAPQRGVVLPRPSENPDAAPMPPDPSQLSPRLLAEPNGDSGGDVDKTSSSDGTEATDASLSDDEDGTPDLHDRKEAMREVTTNMATMETALAEAKATRTPLRALEQAEKRIISDKLHLLIEIGDELSDEAPDAARTQTLLHEFETHLADINTVLDRLQRWYEHDYNAAPTPQISQQRQELLPMMDKLVRRALEAAEAFRHPKAQQPSIADERIRKLDTALLQLKVARDRIAIEAMASGPTGSSTLESRRKQTELKRIEHVIRVLTDQRNSATRVHAEGNESSATRKPVLDPAPLLEEIEQLDDAQAQIMRRLLRPGTVLNPDEDSQLRRLFSLRSEQLADAERRLNNLYNPTRPMRDSLREIETLVGADEDIRRLAVQDMSTQAEALRNDQLSVLRDIHRTPLERTQEYHRLAEQIGLNELGIRRLGRNLPAKPAATPAVAQQIDRGLANVRRERAQQLARGEEPKPKPPTPPARRAAPVKTPANPKDEFLGVNKEELAQAEEADALVDRYRVSRGQPSRRRTADEIAAEIRADRAARQEAGNRVVDKFNKFVKSALDESVTRAGARAARDSQITSFVHRLYSVR